MSAVQRQSEQGNVREHYYVHGPSRPIHGQLQYIREHDDIDRPPGSVPRIGHHIPRGFDRSVSVSVANPHQLMEIDNVASRKYPGFDALDVLPRGIEAVLATMR